MQPSVNAKSVNSNGQSPARVILICHSNSHPFQKRTILLEPRQEVKVGRSVPRSRVEESNAIFDCKVLSRNHAIIWYVDGKFFIKVNTTNRNGQPHHITCVCVCVRACILCRRDTQTDSQVHTYGVGALINF